MKLFTAVGSELINSNPTTQRQDALPLDIWSNVQQASTVTIELAPAYADASASGY